MILPVAWLKVSTLADTVPSGFETASQSRPSVPLGSTSKPKIKPPSLPRTITSPASSFGFTWNPGWSEARVSDAEQTNSATSAVEIDRFVRTMSE